MILVVTATEMEMRILQEELAGTEGVDFLVAGMGLVETSVQVTAYLAARKGDISAVVNFGVAGAYVGSGLELLDLCLAEKEILGDFGISNGEKIFDFDPKRLPVSTTFHLDNNLLSQAKKVLLSENILYHKKIFVTVNTASGTTERGLYLSNKHHAACENMEGAAVARACAEFGLCCLEFRCISNFVEDRNTERWRLKDACQVGGKAAATLIAGLLGMAGQNKDTCL